MVESDLRVLAHEHDAAEGVYRLTVGYEVEEEVGVDGDRIVHSRVATEDFVWAADDDRWTGKSPKQIAESQLRSVRDALKKRADEADALEQARQAAITPLDGVVGRTV